MDAPDLALLAESVKAYISDFGLAIWPASVDDSDFDWPDTDDWRGFLDVAFKAGVRMIYLHIVHPEDTSRELVNMRRGSLDINETAALDRALGWGDGPCRVEATFVADGMVHRWMIEAEWLADIDDLASISIPTSRRAHPLKSDEDDEQEDDDEEDGWSEDIYRSDWHKYRERERVEVERLSSLVDAKVRQLCVHPAVVAAPSSFARRTAALAADPELQEWHNEEVTDSPEQRARRRASYLVLSALTEATTSERKRRVLGARERVDELALELAEDLDFRAAVNATMRKRAATEFVVARLGFPDADVRDRVLARAKLKEAD